MKINTIYIFLMLLTVVVILPSCQQAHGDSTGSEYMPDMGHSIAYEANYYNYYYYNTWGTEDEYYKYAQPRLPVAGTIARTSADQGGGKYYYPDTEEGRTRAMEEIIANALPITTAGIEEGEELYNIYCAVCHGDKGDGNGYLVRDDGGVYPVAPANFLLDEHINATNGRYMHSIVRGRNMMGSYSDKLSENERWNVIHYIRSLQAKEKKLVYSQVENTLNSVDKPAGENYMVAKLENDHSVILHVKHEDNHDHIDGENHDGHETFDATEDHKDDGHGHDNDNH